MDVNDGSSASRGIFSPQDSPRNAPRSPRSPRSPCTSTPIQAPPTRSHSDSEAMLEEQGAAMRLKGPAENLFLDALSLDPLGGLEVPPPCRLESEKRFPCMKEVTHTHTAANTKLPSINHLQLDAFPRDFIAVSVVFQALNKISESEGDPEYEEEMGGGSLLR